MSLTNLSPHTNCSECVFPASAHHRGSNKKIVMGDAGPVDGKWKNDGPLRTGGPWDEACPGSAAVSR